MENKRREEIAANRLKIIAPLMDSALDRDKMQLLKESVCIQTGLSERTIRRYLKPAFPKNYTNANAETIEI